MRRCMSSDVVDDDDDDDVNDVDDLVDGIMIFSNLQ